MTGTSPRANIRQGSYGHENSRPGDSFELNILLSFIKWIVFCNFHVYTDLSDKVWSISLKVLEVHGNVLVHVYMNPDCTFTADV